MKKLSIEVAIVGKGALSTIVKQDDVFDINDPVFIKFLNGLMFKINSEELNLNTLDDTLVADDVLSAVAECWNMPLTLVVTEDGGKYSDEIIYDQTMNKCGRRVLLTLLITAIISYPVMRHTI